MYDKSTNTITFPHILPTNKLGGKAHTFNSVNGGVTRLADLGIEQNSFFGGNVITLGWIKEYGLYACPSVHNPAEILGFYIHDPSRLTELGRKIVTERFPNYKVSFTVKGEEVLTAEQIRERRLLRQKFIDEGVAPEFVNKATSDELAGLLKAMQSGKSERPLGEVEAVTVAPSTEAPKIEGHAPAQMKKVITNARRSPSI